MVTLVLHYLVHPSSSVVKRAAHSSSNVPALHHHTPPMLSSPVHGTDIEHRIISCIACFGCTLVRNVLPSKYKPNSISASTLNMKGTGRAVGSATRVLDCSQLQKSAEMCLSLSGQKDKQSYWQIAHAQACSDSDNLTAFARIPALPFWQCSAPEAYARSQLLQS